MNTNIFLSIGELALGAKKRREREYAEFLSFYRTLVETMPSEMTALFGTLDGISVDCRGKKESFRIELTVTDFLWWKSRIENESLRFVYGIPAVKAAMLDHFSRKAELHRLSPEERVKLLELLEAP